MNYKLLHNPDKLQEFVDFLPDTKDNESYFIILLARKKWRPESVMPSGLKLKREAVPKAKIAQWVNQLQIEEGGYTFDDLPIHQENLGVYIGFNPRNQIDACYNLVEKCMKVLRTKQDDINIASMSRDIIQTSVGSKNFIDIDVDIKENEDYLKIVEYIKTCAGEENLTFIKTNGGFHCLVRLEKLKGKDGGGKWYQALKSHPFKSELNIMPKENLIPLVGCNQGKFVPHFF